MNGSPKSSAPYVQRLQQLKGFGVKGFKARRLVDGLMQHRHDPGVHRRTHPILDAIFLAQIPHNQKQAIILALSEHSQRRRAGETIVTLKERAKELLAYYRIPLPEAMAPHSAKPLPSFVSTHQIVLEPQKKLVAGEHIENITSIVADNLKKTGNQSIIQKATRLCRKLENEFDRNRFQSPEGQQLLKELWALVEKNCAR